MQSCRVLPPPLVSPVSPVRPVSADVVTTGCSTRRLLRSHWPDSDSDRRVSDRDSEPAFLRSRRSAAHEARGTSGPEHRQAPDQGCGRSCSLSPPYGHVRHSQCQRDAPRSSPDGPSRKPHCAASRGASGHRSGPRSGQVRSPSGRVRFVTWPKSRTTRPKRGACKFERQQIELERRPLGHEAQAASAISREVSG